MSKTDKLQEYLERNREEGQAVTAVIVHHTPDGDIPATGLALKVGTHRGAGWCATIEEAEQFTVTGLYKSVEERRIAAWDQMKAEILKNVSDGVSKMVESCSS